MYSMVGIEVLFYRLPVVDLTVWVYRLGEEGMMVMNKFDKRCDACHYNDL